MSDRWDRDSTLHRDSATVYETFDRTWAGQSHDRIHGDDLVPGVAATIAMNGDNDNVDFDITATQKMISAISGSLLTSLLGKSYHTFREALHILIIQCSHSPRCRSSSFAIAACTTITSSNDLEARRVITKVLQHATTEPWSYCMLPRSLLRWQ
jgi:hypothetical protein